MTERPKCAIEGCNNGALILFSGKWVCGECIVKYDKMVKEQSFNKMQEVMNGN